MPTVSGANMEVLKTNKHMLFFSASDQFMEDEKPLKIGEELMIYSLFHTDQEAKPVQKN